MPKSDHYDAVVIGSGPNGLGAAITLARENCSVLVIEARDGVGGGTRSAELTLPGFVHDICSAVHPLAAASPFFQSIPLDKHGLQFVHPRAPLGHPLDNGRAVILERGLEATAQRLGFDATEYRDLIEPFVKGCDKLYAGLLGPLRIPRSPLLIARFGWAAMRSAKGLARRYFRNEATRALLAGNAAHAVMPLDRPLTAAVALMLMITAHAIGWPFVRGGSRVLAEAMASYLRSLGGRITTGQTVESIRDLPPARAYLFDTAPRHMARIAGDDLPDKYKNKLLRYRHGPAAFKVDWALSDPIPWENQECARAGTVHVGGTFEEIQASESAAWEGRPAERPFVLVAQQSLFDPTRAPAGRHTGWAYCHVPAGCTVDFTERIERQIERFAPGFRDTILARHTHSPAQFEQYNANFVGGDIVGGVQDLRQLFARPVLRVNPYRTPNPRIFICSASTPPGGGVHGMCGYFAARAALRQIR